MTKEHIPQKQFTLMPRDFFRKLDFLNWYRFFFILKELAELEPKDVLEIGPGDGTVKRVYEPFSEKYATMDVNPALRPDFLSDVRTEVAAARNKFDCVVAADILEHIPFADMSAAVRNIYSYLMLGGHALITIPHRAWFLFGLTWLWNYKSTLWRFPDAWRRTYHFVRSRKNPIDSDHQWEIGDGHHKIADVEKVFREAGFKIVKRQALLYVDFWVLKK